MKYHFRIVRDVDYPTEKDIFADSSTNESLEGDFKGFSFSDEALRSGMDCMLFNNLSKDEWNIEIIIKK